MRYEKTGIVTLASRKELVYQCEALKAELARFTVAEYPWEACQIAKLLYCVAKYIGEELWKLRSLRRPKKSDETRAHALAEVVWTSYSYIRFLRATAAHHAPPAIQAALSKLAKHHLPDAAGEFICVVRPQWRYNFVYRSLAHLLQRLDLAVLDPTLSIDVTDAEDFVRFLWERERKAIEPSQLAQWNLTPPLRVAILSFPGLDTENVLAYSLLAHELGHHIDFSRAFRLSTTIAHKVAITRGSVEGEMPGAGPDEVEAKWQDLMDAVGVAIREILADLLATRMVGLAFFLAQSEFLKAVTADWPGPTVILESGYPGIA